MSATGSETAVLDGVNTTPEQEAEIKAAQQRAEEEIKKNAKPARAKKDKPAPRGLAITPQKKKISLKDVDGKAILVECVGTGHCPYPHNLGIKAIITPETAIAAAKTGKITDLHHGGSKTNLGQYKILAHKGQDPAEKLRHWAA